MENLTIEGDKTNPAVNFNATDGTFIISGQSLPEDARAFYTPIRTWIEQYLNNDGATLQLNINLKYFNSSSAKQLLKIFYALEDGKDNGRQVSVLWLHDAEDQMIGERGNEFAQMTEIDFQVKANA